MKIEADWELYAFLTTDIVKPNHDNAMTVILLEPNEWSLWLSDSEEGFKLQKPLPNESSSITDH